MIMKKKINWIIGVLCLIIALLFGYRLGLREGWLWWLPPLVVGLVHFVYPTGIKSRSDERYYIAATAEEAIPEETPTELILLSEEGDRLASWSVYGKNGIVIGRDVGENHVMVNLENTTYASMIDIEHAVLNYSGDSWYVEDVSSQNGVSVQKSDGRKYKISYGKPCRLEIGDIIFIGLTRLQIL